MGNVYSFYTQMFPPKPRFLVEHVPDLTGKVIIVTGGYAGIGKEVSKVLLERNAKVYIAGRNPEKANKAIDELKQSTGKDALFLYLDLANLDSVRKAAEEYKEKETELHVLYNNGAVMLSPMDMLTSDGYDLQFGTNALGHYFFTTLLLPVIISTAEHSPAGEVRVLNVSSLSHRVQVTGLKWDTLKDGPARRKENPTSLYGQSKLANILFAKELARRYGDKGIISVSLHPGDLSTELQRHVTGPKWMIRLLFGAILYPAHLGALTELYAGTSPDVVKLQGQYIWPWGRPGYPSELGNDSELAKKLWDWFEEQIKDH